MRTVLRNQLPGQNGLCIIQMKVTSLLEDIQTMDSINIIIEVLGGPYFHDSKTLSIIDIFTISGNSLSTCLLPAGRTFIYGRFDYQWGIYIFAW